MADKIVMRDIRAARMCSGGARKFFEKQGWSWSDFLKNGIDVETVEKSKDPMALKVAEVARGREQ